MAKFELELKRCLTSKRDSTSNISHGFLAVSNLVTSIKRLVLGVGLEKESRESDRNRNRVMQRVHA